MKRDSANWVIRLLFSLLLIPVGAVLILLEIKGRAGSLLSNMGLALIVAGVVSSFHEVVLRRLEGHQIADRVADRVHGKLKMSPLAATGIRLVTPVRKSYDGYCTWATNAGHQKLFFAGRSVLHRIDKGFRLRGMDSAEEVISRRVCEGASLRIMFLDPRSNLITRLAKEEGQTDKQLLGDIATSIGICRRVHDILRDRRLPEKSYMEVRLFDEVPYFAYHQVDKTIIIGFYFSSVVGHSTAAYEVLDAETKSLFENHFLSMFRRACDRTLLKIDPHGGDAELDHGLLSELTRSLSRTLDGSQAEHLIREQVQTPAIEG